MEDTDLQVIKDIIAADSAEHLIAIMINNPNMPEVDLQYLVYRYSLYEENNNFFDILFQTQNPFVYITIDRVVDEIRKSYNSTNEKFDIDKLSYFKYKNKYYFLNKISNKIDTLSFIALQRLIHKKFDNVKSSNVKTFEKIIAFINENS